MPKILYGVPHKPLNSMHVANPGSKHQFSTAFLQPLLLVVTPKSLGPTPTHSCQKSSSPDTHQRSPSPTHSWQKSPGPTPTYSCQKSSSPTLTHTKGLLVLLTHSKSLLVLFLLIHTKSLLVLLLFTHAKSLLVLLLLITPKVS